MEDKFLNSLHCVQKFVLLKQIQLCILIMIDLLFDCDLLIIGN